MTTENTIELFVPGRLCLFGEHSDWAGRYVEINADVLPGYAIVTGIDLGIYATVKKSDIFFVSSINEKNEKITFSCEMELNTLKEKAKEQHFFCYACGVAAYLLEHYQIGGVSISIDKVTLPIKKGLSSSAAICVLVTKAFNEIYQLRMSINGEMQAAYRGELLTSSRCGRLDQACAYGIRTICMEFSGSDIAVEKLKVGRNLYWVFADLYAQKDTKKILSDLNKAYPFPQTEIDKKVHEALGKDNHAVVSEALKLFAAGDAEKIGALMKKAQKIFDTKVSPCCSELMAPKLHAVLNDGYVNTLVYGGKGVGSQGDGSVQFIAKDKQCQETLITYLNNTLKLQAFPFVIPTSERVRKAIIPLAGYGTRMYPATRFIKKELLPVVDGNGMAKPVILYLLEELEEAVIDEIILVVGAGETTLYQEMFISPLDYEHINKLPERFREYEKLINKVCKKIKFVEQSERRGFGHAVYQARQHLDNEPALLLLGDFIYKSNINLTCTRQTINAYRKSGGQLTVAIKEIPLHDVVHYGVITGSFDNDRNYLMNVSEMVEKPTIEYAKNYLAVKDKYIKNCYYATFGQYVLTPDIFDYLEADISKHDAEGDMSEIQLTSSLQKSINKKGMTGVLVDGKSYDVGIPDAYIKTITDYGK